MPLQNRRRVLALRLAALCIATVSLTPSAALAQAAGYPSRPVKLVVPYAAGGIADMLGRVVAERLSVRWGQPVVIDNRPGVGGHVGGEFVANAPADGYTLMLGTISHNGASQIFKNLRYDPTTDLQPVALLAESPNILLVSSAVPAKSVAELLTLARAKPGHLTYGSAGNGSAMHMAAELFKYMAKVDIVQVPYRGSAPAMADLLAGQTTLLFESAGTAPQHIQSGKVRALAVTSARRNPRLPDLPTLAEAGVPGYAAVPWYTISAARGVPRDLVQKINADINWALKSPEVAQRETLGVLPLGGSPEEAVARNKAETERWGAVITAAKIQAD